MTLSDLNFDNPNNACLSLRTVAELVRQGELIVTAALEGEVMRLRVEARAPARKRAQGGQ